MGLRNSYMTSVTLLYELPAMSCILPINYQGFMSFILESEHQEEVISAPNKNTFKNRLDKFWENQPIKYRYREPYLTGTGPRIYLTEKD